MGIGDTVLVFDSNHRIYRRNVEGRAFGGPIYRSHFVPTKIIGETSRSWILQRYNIKVSKKTLEGIYTEQQADDLSWVHEHRHRISDEVRSVKDIHILRQIAELIRYKEAQT